MILYEQILNQRYYVLKITDPDNLENWNQDSEDKAYYNKLITDTSYSNFRDMMLIFICLLFC